MELPLVNVSTCELRSVIRFFTAKNETAVNIHRNLVSVYGGQNVHDDERSGRPVTATDNAAVAAVRNVVEADRRVTIDEIMIRLPPGIEIGRSSIGTIMSDVLNFRKVCARWVPRLLSENHKQQRMEAARAFLEMHRRDGDQLFSRIVTGDESWVHHSTPETKRQSMVWKKPEESAPKKAKITISAGKVMVIVFWDSRTTQTLLENFKWEIFTHPPYSPDLAPSDFHLFPALELHLEGKHFANDDEVQAEANHWLRIGHALVQQWYQKIATTVPKMFGQKWEFVNKTTWENFLATGNYSLFNSEPLSPPPSIITTSSPTTVTEPTVTSQKYTTITEPTTTSQKPTRVTEPTTTSQKPTTVTEPTTTSQKPTTVTEPTTTSQKPTTVTEPTTTSQKPTTVTEPTTTSQKPTTVTEPTTTSQKPTTVTEPTTTSQKPTTVTEPTTTSQKPTTVTEPTTTSQKPTTVTEPTTTSQKPTTVTEPTTSQKPTTVTEPTTTSQKPTTVTEPTTTSQKPTTVTEPTTTSQKPTTVTEPTASQKPTTVTEPTTTSQKPTTVTEPTTTSQKPTTVTEPTTTSQKPTTVTEPTTTSQKPTTVTEPTTTNDPETPPVTDDHPPLNPERFHQNSLLGKIGWSLSAIMALSLVVVPTVFVVCSRNRRFYVNICGNLHTNRCPPGTVACFIPYNETGEVIAIGKHWAKSAEYWSLEENDIVQVKFTHGHSRCPNKMPATALIHMFCGVGDPEPFFVEHDTETCTYTFYFPSDRLCKKFMSWIVETGKTGTFYISLRDPMGGPCGNETAICQMDTNQALLSIHEVKGRTGLL
ncbi:hypothetical protein LAZ67_15000883 [Cordylochernes scorpioides]|uniref:MRH domain-containing protein n=1 Tax=Cordylochernes scorpioides TaxID=51811 RepID=A0ABY6L9F7_9ARAC|nr:hypothetical protein LAZ67_15000883 [Cordylochernes scorpioides]